MRKILSSLAIAALIFGAGCDKVDDNLHIPPEQATFLGAQSGTLFVTSPTASKKIGVGITTTSGSARTLNIKVTSPTGAVAGTHYTISSTTITIPAGKVIDSIEVKGIQAAYTSGRKDTLILSFTEPGVPSSDFNGTYTLVLRGPCFEGDVDLSTFLGAYNNTNEVFGTSAYGPYSTTVTAFSQTSATTGTLTIANIWDGGWTPVTVTLDWTDPANRKVTIPAQSAGGNAADAFGATYAGQAFGIRTAAAGPGTFSACNGTIQLKANLGVYAINAWSGTTYTVNLAR